MLGSNLDQLMSDDRLSEKKSNDDDDSNKNVRKEVGQVEKSTNKFWDVEQLATPVNKTKKNFWKPYFLFRNKYLMFI